MRNPAVRSAFTALVLVATLLALHAGAIAQSDSNGAMSDREFARFASRASLAEIKEAQIALERSKNDTVKSYAKMMIDDHNASNEALAKAAAGENVPLPKILTPAQETEVSQLNGLSGTEFDKTYMTDQMNGHYKVVASAQAEVETGNNAAVKGFATQYLSAEARHLRMAQAINSQADKYFK